MYAPAALEKPAVTSCERNSATLTIYVRCRTTDAHTGEYDVELQHCGDAESAESAGGDADDEASEWAAWPASHLSVSEEPADDHASIRVVVCVHALCVASRYRARVRALNRVGTGPFSPSTDVNTGAPAHPPVAAALMYASVAVAAGQHWCMQARTFRCKRARHRPHVASTTRRRVRA